MDIISYILSKKYTNETAIQFGGLKGANCQIKSAVKQDHQNIITFQWKNDEGEIRENTIIVEDGTPIYLWKPGNRYIIGDIAIYNNCFFYCIVNNADTVFDDTNWIGIGSPDGNWDIVEHASELPMIFTLQDRKIYYAIEEQAFYLWNGLNWVIISNQGTDPAFRRGVITLTPETQFPLTVEFLRDLPDTNYLISLECIDGDATYLVNRLVPFNKTKHSFDLQLDDFFIETTGHLSYVAYKLVGTDLIADQTSIDQFLRDNHYTTEDQVEDLVNEIFDERIEETSSGSIEALFNN